MRAHRSGSSPDRVRARPAARLWAVLVALAVLGGCGSGQGVEDAGASIHDVTQPVRDQRGGPGSRDGDGPGADVPLDGHRPGGFDAASDLVAARDVTDARDALPDSGVVPTVSVGYEHTCAVRADGSGWCWGRVLCGALGQGESGAGVEPTPARVAPPEPVEWASVAAGFTLSCGIDREGGLWCWGCDGLGDDGLHDLPVPVEPGITWSHVSAGAGNGCAIRTDGRLFCWGDNDYGEVGDGTTEERRQPTEVQGGGSWRDVLTAGKFVCALRNSGRLYCWGASGYGLFGLRSDEYVTAPRAVLPSVQWRSVSAGSDMLCAIQTDGTLWCWGATPEQQGGPPEQLGSDTDWASVALGLELDCALKQDGSAWCWGQAPVGDGSFRPAEEPVRVAGNHRWLSLSSGLYHACGVREDGEILCWGRNELGMLGLGEPLPAVGDVLQVHHPEGLAWRPFEPRVGGDSNLCAIDQDGSLWCWGRLRDSLPFAEGWPGWFVPWPVRIGTEDDWVSVALPSWSPVEQQCGIREGERLHCLGEEEFLDEGWTAVVSHSDVTCALDRGGCIHCWGRWLYWYGDPDYPNEEWVERDFPGIEAGCGFLSLTYGGRDERYHRVCGVAGTDRVDCLEISVVDHDTLEVIRSSPLAGRDWVAATAGHWHTCAIDREDALWCAGRNTYGQLGVGPGLGSSEEAVRVGASDDLRFRSARANRECTCAVSLEGELWCWGRYCPRQFSANEGADYLPVRYSDESGWDTVAVLGTVICATKTIGDLWCWGPNASGSLGNPGNWFRAEPAPVAFPEPLR